MSSPGSSSTSSTSSASRGFRGRLTALSHVLYMSGTKCFLLTLQEKKTGSDSEVVHLVVPIQLRDWHFLQKDKDKFVGCDVVVTRIRKIKNSASPEGFLFRATSKSTVKVLSPPPASPSRPLLPDSGNSASPHLYFEGVVTNDCDSTSGVVVLNKRAVLVATALCHITNVRRIATGQKVSVVGAHAQKIAAGSYDLAKSSSVALVLCARSHLKVEDGDPSSSLHCKEENQAFGRDTVVDVALSTNCHFGTILSLLRTRRWLLQSVKDASIRTRLLQKEAGRNLLQETCSSFCETVFSSTNERSLLQEFCDPLHRLCPIVNAPPPGANLMRLSTSNGDACRQILERLREEREVLKQRRKQGELLTWCKVDFADAADAGPPILLGHLSADAASGQYRLESEEGSLVVCLSETEARRAVNETVAVLEYSGVLEWFDGGGVKGAAWERFYVIPKRVKTLFRKFNQEKMDVEEKEGEDWWTVLNCSGPNLSDTGSSLRVSLLARRSNDVTAKRFNFPVSELFGHRSLPAGSKFKLQAGAVRNKLAEVDVSVTAEGRRDMDAVSAYELGELGSAPGGMSVITVEAEVAERWFEQNKFSDSFDRSKSNSCTLDQDIGILPRSTVCHVKLKQKGNFGDSPAGDTVSFYLSNTSRNNTLGVLMPLGMVVGSVLRLGNVRQVVSKKGHPYLVPTDLTNVSYLGDGTAGTWTKVPPREALLGDLYRSSNVSSVEAHWYNLTLERVVKVSLSLSCQACSSRLARGGRCTFPGCHAASASSSGESTAVRICSGLFRVSDETTDAQLVVSDENQLRHLLRFSRPEWDLLFRSCLESGSELLYLHRDSNSSARNNVDAGADFSSAVSALFELRCELLSETVRVGFEALARPFREDGITERQRKEQSSTSSSADSRFPRGMFCIHIKNSM